MDRTSMNIQLRNLKAADKESLLKYANNAKIANSLTNRFPPPYLDTHAVDFIAFANLHQPAHIQAISIQEALIGAKGVHPQEGIFFKNAEMG